MEHEVAKILEVYSFEEILEMNNLTEEDVVLLLYQEGYIKLPEYKPL